jgi:signal recognition particle receptor subunit beta
MWDDLVRGAIGAVVLVVSRRLADAFASIDFFEDRRLPYVIAMNCFDGVQHHAMEDVREALTIEESVPMITCDARDRESVKQALIALVQHAMRQRIAAARQ